MPKVFLLLLSLFTAAASAMPCEVLLVGERDRRDLTKFLESFVPEVLPGVPMVAAGRFADLADVHRLLTVRSRSIEIIERTLARFFSAAHQSAPDSSLARAARRLRAAYDDEAKLTFCLVPARCPFPGPGSFHAYTSDEVVIGSKHRPSDGETRFKVGVDPGVRSSLPETIHLAFMREQTAEEFKLMSDFMVDLVTLASRYDVMSDLNAWVKANRRAIDRGAGGLLSYVQKDRGRYVVKQGFAQTLLEAEDLAAQIDLARAIMGPDPALEARQTESTFRTLREQMPLAARFARRLGLNDVDAFVRWSRRAMADLREGVSAVRPAPGG